MLIMEHVRAQLEFYYEIVYGGCMLEGRAAAKVTGLKTEFERKCRIPPPHTLHYAYIQCYSKP